MSKSVPRVALFGGSFDPVHRGHLFIAERALEECGLDRVIFVPCWRSPHKSGNEISDAADRVAMLRLATEGIDWAEISEWELSRQEASYSWTTAEHFAGELEDAELFWILGADQWGLIETWAKPDVLAGLVTFVVFPRGGAAAEAKDGFRMVSVDASFDASGTEVRRRVRDGEEIGDLVLPSVEEYVRARELYVRAESNGS